MRHRTGRTFASPEVMTRLRSLAIAAVAGKRSRDRLAVTITALVRVSDNCGSTAISELRQTSDQVGMTSCGVLNDNSISLGRLPLFPSHPATAPAARVIGVAGQYGNAQ
jgi:hypothetical protein